MQKKFTSLAIAGTLGLAGLGTGAVFVPALASAATNDKTSVAPAADRRSAIKNALSGLVEDKTLTQAQAEKVASALDQALPRHGRGSHHGPGGKGSLKPALDAAASALGITEDELRAHLMAGKTLAEVAKAEGVSVKTLITKLVTAAEKALTQAVQEGHLTQAQADERKADLEAHITNMVNREGRPHGPRGRHGGPGTVEVPAPADA